MKAPREHTGLRTAIATVCVTAGLACAASPAWGLPSNSDFADQWALLNSGQFSGTPGDDIDISQAWELEPGGNAAVLVGVVDSGVNFAQPSLTRANLYTQSPEGAPTGCATALYGCSFVGGGTPTDEDGHGTATTGEIFAGWGEGPYAGVAPFSTLIVAKVVGSSSTGSTTAEAAGLDYVADRGARVVNVSIAGAQSAAVHEAIASHPNTLFVAAAGNSSADDDDGAAASYPCADPSDNVICVAASDSNDRLASFSNYGASTVDLSAPGTNIATLTLEGASDGFNGTSFAAPLVTGTAALAFALRPDATVAQVKQAIVESVDRRQELAGRTVSGGRLNAYRALEDLVEMLPTAPPTQTSAPLLTGTAAVGQALAASTGEWTGGPTSTAIAWERCDEAGGHCQLIPGAVGAHYALTAADAGYTVRAEVTATSSAGAEIAFSASTAPIAAGASSEAAGAPASAALGDATAPAGASAAPAAASAPSRPAAHATAARKPPAVRTRVAASHARRRPPRRRPHAHRAGHTARGISQAWSEIGRSH